MATAFAAPAVAGASAALEPSLGHGALSAWRALGRQPAGATLSAHQREAARLFPGVSSSASPVVILAAVVAGTVRRRQRRSRCQVRCRPKYGGSAEYWDSRYTEDAADGHVTYDWLGDYSRFKEHIEAAIGGDKEAKVLDLGCGNARLTEELYDVGIQNITALDISSVAIDMMSKRNAESRPNITWVVGSVFALDLPNDSFDLIIDKSTLDAVSCDEESMNTNMVKMMGEVSRVLRPGGTYLIFSACAGVVPKCLALPHISYEVEHTNIPMPFSTLDVFACRKKEDANAKAAVALEGTLATAEDLDRRVAEHRRQQREAEERLQRQAPTSFGVLD